MAMERRAMNEMKFDGSLDKLVEEDSSSRAASKVFAAKRLDSASRAGKVAMGDACKICVYKGLDSGSCDICVAKAAALARIKAAGGDSIKAAKDSASRARRDVLVIKAVPSRTAAAKPEEEGDSKPVGIVKKTVVIPEARVKMMLADPPRTVLAPLSQDFFQEYPSLREPVLALTLAVLKGIEHKENVVNQYFNKGHAVVEWEIDYGQGGRVLQ